MTARTEIFHIGRLREQYNLDITAVHEVKIAKSGTVKRQHGSKMK